MYSSMSFAGSRTGLQHAGPSHSIYSINLQPQSSQQPAAPSKPAPVALVALEKAARAIQDQLVADAQAIPELSDMLQSHAAVPYSSSTDKAYVPFYKRRTVNIPDGLFEFYDSARTFSSFMGLMPDIDRAWFTIDNKLFIWDYMDGNEMNSFVDQPNVINHVGLVKTKVGVFIDEIQHLLVICTPVQLLLLGLSSSPLPGPSKSPRTEIKLYATDMSIDTDNIQMTSVAGTRNGRVFMCGDQDGCLYELVYQASEGWFTKRVQLVNHSVGGYGGFLPFFNKPDQDRLVALAVDDGRNCVYALSAKCNISLYYLGPNGSELTHIKTISNVHKAAQALMPGLPALDLPNFTIAKMHVIELNESRNICLLAVTNTGVRLFFSHYKRNPYGGGLVGALGVGARSAAITPPGFELVFVRPPPNDLTNPDSKQALTIGRAADAPVVITGITASCQTAGLTIGAQEPPELHGSDLVLCTCPDLAKIVNSGPPSVPTAPPAYSAYQPTQIVMQRPLVEYATLLSVPGHTWAIAEARRAAPSGTPPASPAPNSIYELATQFSEPPRQFLLLTNEGLVFVAKKRAVDHLKSILEQTDNDMRVAQTFCQNFGRTESAAMLLALASGNTFLSHDTLDMSALDDFSVNTVSAELSAVAKQLFYSQGGVPVLKSGATVAMTSARCIHWLSHLLTLAKAEPQVEYSGRREGFALYFARLVRPIWRAKIVRKGSGGKMESNVVDHVLVTVQKNLDALRSFLDRNPQMFSSPIESRDPSLQDAWKAERTSAMQLQSLLSQTIEAISFILLLNDYRLSEVASQCDAPTQQNFESITYEELITTKKGRDVARALVNAIINQQIGQQISVDTISEVLQQRCGSFCSADDVLMYKAIENVRKAKESRDPIERAQCLRTSLKFFSKGSSILEPDKLQEVVAEYRSLHYAKGSIELPLKCAREWDGDNIGKSYWAAGCPPNDPRAEFYSRRTKCYNLVVDSILSFGSLLDTRINAGAPPAEIEELGMLRASAYQIALGSQDEVFHSFFYDWLIAKNMNDQLLEFRTPYIEPYLRREPLTFQRAELLHIYYVKTGQFLRAAETCAALAESMEFDLTIEKRIELFTYAVSYAKSHPSSDFGRQETAVEFLTDLEEKLEVAQVQLEIYNALQPRFGNNIGPDGTRVRRLGQQLMTISELFQEYADPYGLLDIKLLILHVSDHRDTQMALSIWEAIFELASSSGPPEAQLKELSTVVPQLGQRFYPSEIAFPLEDIALLLERFVLQRSGVAPQGWVPRLLLQCNVPFHAVFDVLHKMYESQVPPFHVQDAVQWLSGDMAILVADWVAEATRSQSSIPRREFPANLLDETIDLYLRELARDHEETRALFEQTKLVIRRHY